MRISTFAFVASAVLLIGFAASTSARNEDPGPPDASAIIAGSLFCYDNGSSASLSLAIMSGYDGGVIGIPSDGYGFWINGEVPGTCAEAIAARTAQLPSVCSAGPSAWDPNALAFVCSGGARSVVGAVGGLARSVISP